MHQTIKQLLPAIELEPSQPPIGSVIWLHGLGADGHDFAPIVPVFNFPETMPLRFIFPHAPEIPVTMNNGYVMRAWYDIVSISMDQHADQKGIQDSVQKIIDFIEHEKARGIPSHKIMIAGFSQGAVIALSTALAYTETLGGIIALSGYLPEAEYQLTHAKDANKKTPIFLAHGNADPVVPFFLGKSLHQLLEKFQYPVDWHTYEMQHSVCPQEIQDIAQWIKKLFG